MCWRLSVFSFSGSEGRRNTKNRFRRDKNNVLPWGCANPEPLQHGLAESFLQGGSRPAVLLPQKGAERCSSASERGRAAFTCAKGQLHCLVCAQHDPLSKRGSPQAEGSSFAQGELLERLVGAGGDSELFGQIPSIFLIDKKCKL